jgi:hypothetical protein
MTFNFAIKNVAIYHIYTTSTLFHPFKIKMIMCMVALNCHEVVQNLLSAFSKVSMVWW